MLEELAAKESDRVLQVEPGRPRLRLEQSGGGFSALGALFACFSLARVGGYT